MIGCRNTCSIGRTMRGSSISARIAGWRSAQASTEWRLSPRNASPERSSAITSSKAATMPAVFAGVKSCGRTTKPKVSKWRI